MVRKLTLTVALLAGTAAVVAAVSFAARGPAPTWPGGHPAPRLVGSGSLPRLAGAAPGAAATGVVSVANRGDTAADVVLQLSASGSPTLRRELVLTVTRGGSVLYAGPYRTAQELRLGRLAGGGRQDLRVRVELPRSAANGVQGRGVSLGARFVGGAA